MDNLASNESNNETLLIEVLEPITHSRTGTIFVLICLAQGIPINLLAVIVIVCNQRMHNPRNAFWFGIITMNLVSMCVAALKQVVVHISPDGIACLTFSFLTGKAYTILLFILLMATLDRYIAITHPLYHRKHVTVRRVVVLLICCFLAVFGLLSLPLLTGWAAFGCGYSPKMGHLTTCIRLVLLVFNIYAQVVVYLQTRKYLRNQGTVNMPLQPIERNKPEGSTRRSEYQVRLNDSPHGALNNDERLHSISSSLGKASRNGNGNSFFVHRPNKSISKLELEAALTLVIGVLTICITTAPRCIVHFALNVCDQYQMECSILNASYPYVRRAGFIHSVYGPLIYMIRSREFSDAFIRMIRRSQNTFSLRHNPRADHDSSGENYV